MKKNIIILSILSAFKLNAQINTRFNQISPQTNTVLWNSKSKKYNNDSIPNPELESDNILPKIKCSLPTDFLYITSDYGYRIHPILHKKKFHSGIDIKTNRSNIFSILNGIVIKCAFDKKLGYYIKIKHKSITSVYGHLSKIQVKEGQKVKAGQIIGISGSTGRATGDHLHFAIKHNNKFINPNYLIHKIQQNSY